MRQIGKVGTVGEIGKIGGSWEVGKVGEVGKVCPIGIVGKIGAVAENWKSFGELATSVKFSELGAFGRIGVVEQSCFGRRISRMGLNRMISRITNRGVARNE